MRRCVRGVALAAALALAIAACGSSSTSSKRSSKGSSSGETAAAASAANAVAALEKRPTTLNVPALPSKPKPGGTIDYVYCGLPVCQAFGTYVQAAAAAVGWHVKEINAGLTPQSVSAAYDQAVVDHPNGVIGSGGFPASLFTHQLAELAAAKIPVVLSASAGGSNVTAELAGPPFLSADGRELGDYILAASKGHNAHVAIFTTPATPIYSGLHAAIKSAISAPDCDGCSVTIYSFPETDIGSKLPNEVTSFLNTHSNVNYLVFDFSNEVDGVPAALATAGLSSKVKILTTDTTSTESEYLKRGQETAAAAVPWPEFFWGGVGIILAHSEGASVTPWENISYPHMILTGANVVNTTGLFPLVADYQSVFKKAWHVG
jgi:ribose transport system substrate-binding protein